MLDLLGKAIGTLVVSAIVMSILGVISAGIILSIL